MNKRLKLIIKKLIPLVFIDIFNKSIKPLSTVQYGWFGNYSSWEEAALLCEGYDKGVILEKVKNSLLKVKNSEAIYERDSVLFDRIEYSWPLLAIFLRIGIEQKSKLHIIDFGGSLGSTYYQNKDFLSVIDDLHWNIVEQKHFVDTGRNLFENEQLQFYYSIKECMDNHSCSVILLSSVLQYLENPESVINQILQFNFEYIIFDRTAFIVSEHHRLTIQNVPPEIYPASYPCWFFNETKLMESFNKHYEIKSEFDALDKSNLEGSYFKGFVLKRKIC